ncbi:helix-turn-helix domain-containing protein [Devosia sp. D6-9]|nr:helix-turn-helix domain-containing protein [Devosia sp. D6-9]
MRTFQEPSTPSEPNGDEEIDRFTLSYMAGLARDRIHQMILGAFVESGLTKSQLARRLGMDKSRLSRILNTSSNITAETLGEVMFAIDGSCPKVERHWPMRDQRLNMVEPVWLAGCMEKTHATSAMRFAVVVNDAVVRSVSTTRPVLLTVNKTATTEAREHA